MKKLLNKATYILIIVLLASLSVACGRDDKYNGYLNVGMIEKVISLDTAAAADASSATVIRSCIEGLLRESKDGTPEPGMAERYDISDDGLTYTFYLREAYWNNGTPVTAHDFVYAWRRMVSSNAPYTSVFSIVAHIKNAKLISTGDNDGNRLPKEELGVYALDDKTLQVELESPTPYFTYLVSFWAFAPLNEEFFTSIEDGMYATSEKTFLSNGPFMLSEYMPGTYTITLDKNPGYWDADTVKIPGIKIQAMSSPDIGLEAYRKGAIDIFTLTGNQVENVGYDETLTSDIAFVCPGSLTYATFQTEDEDLCNVNLRKAISFSVNRESIVDNVLYEVGEPAYNAASRHYALHRENGEDFSYDDAVYKEYCDDDKERAKQYYDIAKKELGRDTFDIELMYSNQAGSGGFSNMALLIKGQIEKNLPGVTVSLVPVPKAELKQRMAKHAFELVLQGRSPDYADPMSFLSAWRTDSSFNYGKWSNEAYDELIDQCSVGEISSDYEKRWIAMHEAEKIVIDNAVIMPLVYRVDEMLINQSVSGYRAYMGKPNFMYVSKMVK